MNNIEERDVALTDEFNKLFINNEEQKQFSIMIVKGYRRRDPSSDPKKL